MRCDNLECSHCLNATIASHGRMGWFWDSPTASITCNRMNIPKDTTHPKSTVRDSQCTTGGMCVCCVATYINPLKHQVLTRWILASFPGPAQLSQYRLQVMESWAGPGNEARWIFMMSVVNSEQRMSTSSKLTTCLSVCNNHSVVSVVLERKRNWSWCIELTKVTKVTKIIALVT